MYIKTNSAVEKLKDIISASCSVLSLTYVVTGLGRNYESMFLDSWKFDYQPSASLSEITPVDRFFDELSKMGEMNGVHFDGLRLENEEVTSYAKDQIAQERPVIAIVDAFYCPWTPNYQKSHLEHAFIINDYKENEKEYICLDLYYGKENCVLTEEELATCYKAFVTYELGEDKTEAAKVQEAVVRSAASMLCDEAGKNHFESMREFGSLFADNAEGFQKRQENNVVLTPVYKMVDYVLQGREKYEIALDYSASLAGTTVCPEMKSEMDNVIAGWKKVRAMVVKAYYSSKMDHALLLRISSQIQELADREENMAKQIVTTGFTMDAKNTANQEYIYSINLNLSKELVTL